ncbi:MAG: Nif3-like dinuclear metal center hexameric protein [Fimbriimonadales bacterium]
MASTVGSVLDWIDRVAPWRSAYRGDPVGLQVGSPSATVERALVSLDRSFAAAQRAIETESQLWVTHHPLLFRPLERLTDGSDEGRLALLLARHGVSLVSAHTNWDAARGGVNDTLAELLGLQDARPFGPSGPAEESKLVVFAPEEAAEALVDALAEAGCGEIGLYRRCAFFSPGTGTFQPLPGADPFVGTVGGVEHAAELRLEMLVPNERVNRALQALRAVHPYEEPAFDVIPLADRKPWPIGRVGRLQTPLTAKELALLANEALKTRTSVWGRRDQSIRTLAVVGGSGDDLWASAKAAGADALLTGEVRQHHGLAAQEEGFAMLAAGHYATENPGTRRLCELLARAFPNVAWEFFDPEPGQGGRPIEW